MAVYNEEKNVSYAVQSILNQTFKDWEFIIVDDNSTDDTNHIIKQLISSDDRIKLFKNAQNVGLASSLNFAIQNAHGKYIARMDADDISYSHRLLQQVLFLKSNPSINVVGSNADFVDKDFNFLAKSNLPLTPSAIRRDIFRRNTFIHSSIMCRSEFYKILNGYSENLRKKQDYDLWLRGINRFQYSNISECLIKYKVDKTKPISTDLYGFYVGIYNSFRLLSFKLMFWTFLRLFINIIKKFGYIQKSYRKI